MSIPTVRIYNSEGEFVDREMTDTEYEQYGEIAAKDKAKFDAEIEAQAKRTVALEKLTALGLNLDDLKALGL
jgi:hypothetical protein